MNLISIFYIFVSMFWYLKKYCKWRKKKHLPDIWKIMSRYILCRCLPKCAALPSPYTKYSLEEREYCYDFLLRIYQCIGFIHPIKVLIMFIFYRLFCCTLEKLRKIFSCIFFENVSLIVQMYWNELHVYSN